MGRGERRRLAVLAAGLSGRRRGGVVTSVRAVRFAVLACVMFAFSPSSCGAAPASRWSVQRTPNLAGAKGRRLYGVSCVSRTACTAVGAYAKSARIDVTLADRWNGTSWSVQRTPNPARAKHSELFGVSCVSRTACTAVGYTNSAGAYVTLVEGWNGTSWTVQRTPNPADTTFSELLGVSCVSRTACTAVGHYTNRALIEVTLAERWNGTSWTVQRTPNPGGAKFSANSSNELLGVSCSSRTACTAVGDYANPAGTGGALVERWNGTWTVQRTPHRDSELLGVSCVSRTVCTAVGGAGNRAGYEVTLAERWNGTSWTVQRTPNATGAKSDGFLSVSCVSKTACTAVGDYYINAPGPPVALAERYS